MNKKEFIDFLMESNKESMSTSQIMEMTGWNKSKTIKFIKNSHTLGSNFNSKFRTRTEFFKTVDGEQIQVRLHFDDKNIVKEYSIINCQFLSDNRKLDIEIGSLLYNKEYSWDPMLESLEFGEYRGAWVSGHDELPFFSSDLNDSIKAMEKLNNLWFAQHVERISDCKIYECLTYNGWNLEDKSIKTGKDMPTAIVNTILDYLKKNPRTF